MLHRQASFAPTFFPEGAEYGTDYDFFYLPPIDDGGTGGNPMLTAGDLLVAFDDSPVVREFVEFAGTVEAQEAWASNGNMLCSNSNCDPSVYPDRALAKQGRAAGRRHLRPLRRVGPHARTGRHRLVLE